MSIEVLPNELLAPILNNSNIPLQQRFLLRAVSPRWLAVIEDAFTKQTSLILRDKYSRKPEKTADDLVVTERLDGKELFNDNLFHLLARLFPSITELNVSLWNVSNFHQLPELLKKFRSTLTSFSLYGFYDFRDDDNQTSKLIAKAINSLTNLTRLKVFARDLNELLDRHLAPTFSRLEQLSFYDGTKDYLVTSIGSRIFNSLSNRCTHLMLHSKDFNWLKVGKISSSLTHLELVDFSIFYMSDIRLALPTLHSFTVHLHKQKVCLDTLLLQNLSHLNHLTELGLVGVLYWMKYFKSPLRDGDDQPLYNIKRLFLHLIIHFKDTFEGKHFCSTLASWFPSLENLTIKCNEFYHDRIKKNLNEFPSSPTVCLESCFSFDTL